MMKIIFEIEEDVSVLKNNSIEYYLDSYLQFFVNDRSEKNLIFSTSMHSTILIEFSGLLIELYRTGEKQTLNPFGNASIYTLTKKGPGITINKFDELTNTVEWEYDFNLLEFIKAYIKTLQEYLDSMLVVEVSVRENTNFILLEERLELLKRIDID
ncbi:hypothetical protein QWT69_14095 [Sporosarcina oncorhynchi]|uniref:Uncharacterized protein n=1 Tax=Sporosarcina oncorhynchi TaxID=3056444 RepID=A0ABZ0L4A0_9BACL|nr:hypothetical protein [Sporosarcina sp. T2O-4]WOV86990.1 hypothetical protein QWT69_14095 [Sporosarcina sp. T2O-4]